VALALAAAVAAAVALVARGRIVRPALSAGV
jgi:hypothetical protein